MVGPRISDVGATGLPDVFERSNHYLDVTFSWRLKALPGTQFKVGCQNLLNRAITQYKGQEVYYSYTMGRQFKLGFSYDIF